MEKLIQKREETLTVKIPQEVDHCFTDAVREAVDRRLQTEEINCLEFDFQNTEFMDSSGIGLVMGRYRLMQSRGGRLLVVGVSERLLRVMRLAGLQRLPVWEDKTNIETKKEA